MKIFLVTIGSELLNGKVSEINTDILGKLSRDYNFTLCGSMAIADNQKEVIDALDFALKVSDQVIVTGGLGPTKDDMTESILSDKFGPFKQKIQNHNGSAQGLIFKFENKNIIATPGVPSEFKMMVKKEILSFLNLKSSINNQVIFKTHGMSEAKIFYELDKDLWSKLEEFGDVSCLPVSLGVNFGVNLKDHKQRSELIKVVQESEVSNLLWHIGHESLEELVVKLANEAHLKLGFAESCTGGLLAHKLTNVSGSSKSFYGSIISYSNDVKIRTLKVKKKTLEKYGAVSLETVKEMAQGARDEMNLDIAIATSGIAGPNGGSDEKPVGTVCIGVSSAKETRAYLFKFRGDRDALKERFAKKALHLLLSQIKERIKEL